MEELPFADARVYLAVEEQVWLAADAKQGQTPATL